MAREDQGYPCWRHDILGMAHSSAVKTYRKLIFHLKFDPLKVTAKFDPRFNNPKRVEFYATRHSSKTVFGSQNDSVMHLSHSSINHVIFQGKADLFSYKSYKHVRNI